MRYLYAHVYIIFYMSIYIYIIIYGWQEKNRLIDYRNS